MAALYCRTFPPRCTNQALPPPARYTCRDKMWTAGACRTPRRRPIRPTEDDNHPERCDTDRGNDQLRAPRCRPCYKARRRPLLWCVHGRTIYYSYCIFFRTFLYSFHGTTVVTVRSLLYLDTLLASYFVKFILVEMVHRVVRYCIIKT